MTSKPAGARVRIVRDSVPVVSGIKSTGTPSSARRPDYRFVSRPFWLFSHVFVASALVLFLVACSWQVGRWNERKDLNETIRARFDQPAVTVQEALDAPFDDLDFVRINDSGRYMEPELIRVANRSYNGQAGDWLVALFESEAGQQFLVNRGFLPRDAEPAEVIADSAVIEVVGWLRLSQVQETFGATDNGMSERAPRLDTAAMAQRFGLDIAPLWLQLDDSTITSFPKPVPLPELNNGPHFGYAVQWAIFTLLTAGAYVLVLRKKAREAPRSA